MLQWTKTGDGWGQSVRNWVIRSGCVLVYFPQDARRKADHSVCPPLFGRLTGKTRVHFNWLELERVSLSRSWPITTLLWNFLQIIQLSTSRDKYLSTRNTVFFYKCLYDMPLFLAYFLGAKCKFFLWAVVSLRIG